METFSDGISHGTRTRWHRNGNLKSHAEIEHGEVSGRFSEWYENGRKAVEMSVKNGRPEGQVEAWHPSGARKSRLTFQAGKQVAQEFWADTGEFVATSGTK